MLSIVSPLSSVRQKCCACICVFSLYYSIHRQHSCRTLHYITSNIYMHRFYTNPTRTDASQVVRISFQSVHVYWTLALTNGLNETECAFSDRPTRHNTTEYHIGLCIVLFCFVYVYLLFWLYKQIGRSVVVFNADDNFLM